MAKRTSKAQKRKQKVKQKKSFKNQRKQQTAKSFAAIPTELRADMERMFKGRPSAQADKMLDAIVLDSKRWADEPEFEDFQFELEGVAADEDVKEIIQNKLTRDQVSAVVDKLKGLRERLAASGQIDQTTEVGVLAAGLLSVREIWEEAGILKVLVERSLEATEPEA